MQDIPVQFPVYKFEYSLTSDGMKLCSEKNEDSLMSRVFILTFFLVKGFKHIGLPNKYKTIKTTWNSENMRILKSNLVSSSINGVLNDLAKKETSWKF